MLTTQQLRTKIIMDIALLSDYDIIIYAHKTYMINDEQLQYLIDELDTKTPHKHKEIE